MLMNPEIVTAPSSLSLQRKERERDGDKRKKQGSVSES